MRIMCVTLREPSRPPQTVRFDDLASANPDSFLPGDESDLRDGKTITWMGGLLVQRCEDDVCCNHCRTPIHHDTFGAHTCRACRSDGGDITPQRVPISIADLQNQLFERTRP
jgi:hypothetical protein